MLSTLLITAALAAPAIASTSDAAVRTLDLALHVGPTRLCAVNTTDAPLALVLQGRGDTRREVVVVPAHSSFDVHFAPSVLRNLEVSVVSRSADGLVRSTPFSAEALGNRSGDWIWFDVERSKVSAWIHDGKQLHGIDEHGRSTGASEDANNAPTAPAALHVPVITPHDGTIRETPPRVDRVQLPPV